MITIRVHGTPAPQGSKRHIGNGVMIESSKKVKPWREAVKHAALDVLASEAFSPTIATGPVKLRLAFFLPRPRGHYRTGKNAALLRDSAPFTPVTKPDLDKIIRSTLDALTDAGIYRDDSQVAAIVADKRYADDETPGVLINVHEAL